MSKHKLEKTFKIFDLVKYLNNNILRMLMDKFLKQNYNKLWVVLRLMRIIGIIFLKNQTKTKMVKYHSMSLWS